MLIIFIFRDIMFCMKADCKYQTMCKTAMMSHKVLCNLYSKKVQEHPLDFELFCVCGFSSSDGNYHINLITTINLFGLIFAR